jgi:dephospho-CoA kinase
VGCLSRWPGKYVIGLTGNIATGKSVVRKMLEHLGAYGIDADALAHRAMAKGAPGRSLLIKSFGEWILDEEGDIDRARLARLVFADPKALERLEAIIHPLVTHAIDVLVRRSKYEIIVIEAIKLIESGLASGCDAVWVVRAPGEVQVARLMQKRGLSDAAARQRIDAQPPQEEKVRAASVVISNAGSFEETWQQVQEAWSKLPRPKEPLLPPAKPAAPGKLHFRRGLPQDADAIASFVSRITLGKRRMTRGDVMASFGEKAYLLIERDGNLVGLAGWQVENLVTRIDELYFDPDVPLEEIVPNLITTLEDFSKELQSEAALLFLPPHLAQHSSQWRSAGYQPMTIKGLSIRAWQEAAIQSMPRGTFMWFKRLRADRVMRPI